MGFVSAAQGQEPRQGFSGDVFFEADKPWKYAHIPGRCITYNPRTDSAFQYNERDVQYTARAMLYAVDGHARILVPV